MKLIIEVLAIKQKLILICLLLLSLADLPNADAALYSVCSSGCDYTTIQSAFSGVDLSPGDIIEIRADNPGETKYYREQVTWGSNDDGEPGNSVGLRGRTGDNIVISGAEEVIGDTEDWTDQGSNLWSLSLVTEPKIVLFDSVNIGVEDATPDSKYEWDWVGSILYVYSEGNPTVYYSSVQAGKRDYCVSNISSGDYCSISNIVCEMPNTVALGGFTNYDVSQIDYDNVTVRYFPAYGIYSYNDDAGGVISQCEVFNTSSRKIGTGIISNGGTGQTIEENEVYYCMYGIKDTSASSLIFSNSVTNTLNKNIYLTGAGASVYSNILTGSIIGINIENSSNNIVYKNTISDAWNGNYYGFGGDGKGIFISGSSAGNTVKQNRIDSSYEGILSSVTSGNDGNIISYNIVTDSIVNSIDIQQTGVNPPLIYNNTVFHSPSVNNNPSYTGHGIAFQSNALIGKAANNLIILDIISSNCNGLAITDPGTCGFNLDYNHYSIPTGGVYGNINGINYTSMELWVAALQSDAEVSDLDGNSGSAESHGIYGDHLTITTNDFHLLYNSPCVDAGADLGDTYKYDIENHDQDMFPPWEIGAYVYRDKPVVGVRVNGANFGHAP